MNIFYLVLYFIGFAIAFYIGYQLASRKWKVKCSKLEADNIRLVAFNKRLRRGLRTICNTLGLDLDGDSFTAVSKVGAKSYEFYINCARDEIALMVEDKEQKELRERIHNE